MEEKDESFDGNISLCDRKKSKNDRRFSDEQIKSLESIFKMETKLESRKKMQLARDLGLQPRQVAIWFQNRRARWKSKQIEQDYRVLRADYDNLFARFDSLKKEKQCLQMQLKELSHVVKNMEDDELTYHRDADIRNDFPTNLYAEDGKVIECFGKIEVEEEEEDLLSWGEGDNQEINGLTSPDVWCNLSSNSLLDQSSGSTSNWWENE